MNRPSDFFRGLLIATPICIAFWVLMYACYAYGTR